MKWYSLSLSRNKLFKIFAAVFCVFYVYIVASGRLRPLFNFNLSFGPISLQELKFFDSRQYNFTSKSCNKILGDRNVSNGENFTGGSKPRIFCLIYTKPEYFKTRARAVLRTWASKCDTYKFITSIPLSKKMSEQINATENSIEMNFLSLDILQPAGHITQNEEYQKLSSKLFLTLVDIYRRYDDFDWYLKADDDTFVVVDNLASFLADKEPCEPVTFGYNFKISGGYQSGGAGYVLSNEALMRIGNALAKDLKSCPNTGLEDMDIAACLRNLQVHQGRSVDEKGRDRFHTVPLEQAFNGPVPRDSDIYAENQFKTGPECCSEQTISFHRMKPYDIYKLDSLLNSNPNATFLEIIKKFLA